MQTVTVAAHAGTVRGALQGPQRAPLTGALSMLVLPALQRQLRYLQCVSSGEGVTGWPLPAGIACRVAGFD